MACKKYTDQLIERKTINEDIRPITGSNNHYVSENGNIYKDFGNDMMLKKSININPCNGYVYCAIRYENKDISKRVHRLVAQEFVPNPNNYPVVDHIDNNKSNNSYTNLEWCTISYNIKKAFDDGLAKNDKGYDDSQSIPVIMYEKGTNIEVAKYGSIKEAARETGMHASTIARQVRDQKPVRKSHYFRKDDVSQTTIEKHFINPIIKLPSRVDYECNSHDRSARPLLNPIIYHNRVAG